LEVSIILNITSMIDVKCIVYLGTEETKDNWKLWQSKMSLKGEEVFLILIIKDSKKNQKCNEKKNLYEFL
jgi:hypothetical protein